MNRFECRVCPYEAPLEKNYFEKKDMKQKEVDDVFGGKEEFANADSVASKLFYYLLSEVTRPSRYTGLTYSLFFPLQLNAPPKAATGNVRTSSSCRFAVQMNR